MKLKLVAALALGCTRVEQAKPVLRGAPLSVPRASEISVERIAASPDSYTGRVVRVRGQVQRVCQRKGCWMVLAPEGRQAPTLRVTFKDYGFFVPTDCQRSKAVMEGTLHVETLGVEEAKHLAEEGGPPAPAVPQKELRFEATGVMLYLPDSNPV